MKDKLSKEYRFFNLLFDLYNESFNGTVVINNNEKSKSVSFMFQKIIGVSSNDKVDRLEIWFFKRELLNKEKISVLSKSARSKKKSFWSEVVDTGQFDDDSLVQLLEARTKEIIFNLFMWYDGDIIIKDGDYISGDLPNLDIDAISIIKEGISFLTEEDVYGYMFDKGNMLVANKDIDIDYEPTRVELEIIEKLTTPHSLTAIVKKYSPNVVAFLLVTGLINIKKVELSSSLDDSAVNNSVSNDNSENSDDLKEKALELLEEGKELYRDKQYSEAIKLFSDGIKIYNKNPELFTALGLTLATDWTDHEPEIKKSVMSFKKAIKLDNKNPSNYFYLSQILKHSGNDEDAIKFLNKALEIDPEYSLAKRELENFNK